MLCGSVTKKQKQRISIIEAIIAFLKMINSMGLFLFFRRRMKIMIFLLNLSFIWRLFRLSFSSLRDRRTMNQRLISQLAVAQTDRVIQKTVKDSHNYRILFIIWQGVQKRSENAMQKDNLKRRSCLAFIFTEERIPSNLFFKEMIFSIPLSRMLGKFRSRRVWPVGAVSKTTTSN